jgi:YVTN family beta-propeller protein
MVVLLVLQAPADQQPDATADSFPSTQLDSLEVGMGVYCIDCPSPGDRLYAGTSHELLAYSVPDGSEAASLEWPECISPAICSTPDGGTLALGICSPTPALCILMPPELDEIVRFALYATPDAACSSPAGDFIYAACGADSTLWTFDMEGLGTSTPVKCAGEPSDLCMSPSGDLIYVSLASPTDMVQVFRSSLVPREVDRWATGSNPNGICVSPDGSLLYVVLTGDEAVISMDTSSGTVADSVSVGSIPIGLAILPSGDYLYTANALGCSGTVIRTSDMTVVGSVQSGFRGGTVCVSPDGSLVFTASAQDGYIFVTGY